MEDLKFTTSLDIPDRCKTCPRLTYLKNEVSMAAELKDSVAESVFSDELTEMAQVMSEASEGAQSADDVEQDVRKSAAHMLDQYDARIERLTDNARQLATTCHGSLSMHASKGDLTYTATLCTSATDQVGEPELELVHVLRTEKNPA